MPHVVMSYIGAFRWG